MTDLFHRTLEALERGFTCELIASALDLEHGVFTLAPEEDGLVRYAVEHDFSRLPLRSPAPDGSGEITHVALIDLTGRKISERRLLTAEDLTSGSTPISRAIDLLAARRFYFVLTPHEIQKIITVSDLNRLPVRTYLYTLLSHLESELADLVVSLHGNDDWIDLLSVQAQRTIRDLHAQKQQDDFDTRLIDCTTLTQKITLARKLAPIRRILGHERRGTFDRAARPVYELRNRLAHGLLPISEGAPPSDEHTAQLVAESIENGVDVLRDHLHHRQPLNKPRNPKWLAGVTWTVQSWIERAAAARV